MSDYSTIEVDIKCTVSAMNCMKIIKKTQMQKHYLKSD